MADHLTATRLKYFRIICIPLLSLYLLAGGGTLLLQKNTYHNELELIETNIQEMEIRLFETTLAGYLADAGILTDMVTGILNEKLASQATLDQISYVFKTYARHHKIYDQIRYIDLNGMEKVRVNWSEDDGCWLTPGQALQYKGDRPYFIKGASLDPGGIYLSALNLNIENGQVEQPFKPVLRIVMPSGIKKKDASGVIILNLLGQPLIDALVNTAAKMFMVNDKGDWLKGPSSDLEWQSIFSKTPVRMKDRFPGLWQQMKTQPKGRYKNDSGLFLFSDITPAGLFSSPDASMPKIKTEETWKVIHFIPEDKLSPPWLTAVLLLLAAGMFLLGGLAWMISGLWVRRAEARQRLAKKEQELSTITNAVQDAIVMVDDKGRASYWNASAEKMFGFPESEIIGLDIHQFIAAEPERSMAAQGMKHFPETGNGPFIGHLREVEAQRKDGTLFHAELNLNAVQIQGQWWTVGVVRDISQRKAIEKTMAVREQQLKTFVKYTPAAVAMFDKEIRYIAASDRWYTDYGIQGQEIIGKSHYAVFPEIEGMDEWKQIHQRGLKGEVIRQDEEAFVRADGSTDWLKWEVRPWLDDEGIPSGIIMFTEVITQRKQIEEDLKASEQRLKSAVQKAPYPVMIHAQDGEVLLVNRPWIQLSGYNADQIQNVKNWIKLAYGEKADRELKTIHRLYEIQDTVIRDETIILTADGTSRDWEISTSSLGNLPDGHRIVITMAVDVTERKKVERLVLELNQELEERVRQRTRRLEELVQKLAQKEQIVKLLGDVASTANTADSAEQALEKSLALIADYTGWPLGHVYKPTVTDTVLLISSPLWYVSEPERFQTFIEVTEKTVFKPDEGLPGRVYTSKKACWIEDVTQDDNFPRAKLLTDESVRRAFGFPVITSNEVVAVIEFFSRDSKKPDDTILELANAAGRQLGFVIERKRIEKAMEENEQKFRGLFDQSSQLMGLLNTDGILLQANETALTMVGMNQEDVAGQIFWETPWWQHSRENALEIKKAVSRAADGEFIRLETTYVDKSGQVRDMDFSLKPIMTPSGDISYLIPEGRDITDRKRAEAEAQKLALVVEKTSTGVVITGKEGFIEWCNRGFEKISGYALKEMVGKKPGSFLQGPDTDPDTVALIRHAIQEGKGVQVEIFNYNKSGKPYWLELDIQPIFSDENELIQFIAIETDISERKEAEEALKQFKATLDQTHDAVFIFDPKTFKFIYVNQGAMLQLGYQREELLNMTPLDIKPEFTKEQFLGLVAPLITGDKTRVVFETVHAHKKGRHIPVNILLQLVEKEKNGSPRFVAIVRDITEQKRISLELEAAKDTAEQAAKAKGEFLANMSHEIRTPMNAIIGMTYLANQTELTPRQQDYLNKIETSAKTLLSIINDILDFSKIEAGKLTIEQVPFDITDVINEIVTLSAGTISDKGLDLHISIDDQISPHVIGDPVRVGQVFNNLLSNAVKFTEQGDIEIKIRLLERGSQTQTLECEVADSGIGMSAEQTARLFQAFSQADTAITRKYGGTGLGLAICRKLIRLMGGNIRVKSELGKGTQFIFHLKLVCQAGSKSMAAGRVLPLNLRNLKVLVMDSNPKTLDILEEQLKSLTFKVLSHRSCTLGMEAMDSALLEKEPFELAVLDYRNCRDDDTSDNKKVWDSLAEMKIPVIVLVSVNDLPEAEEVIKYVSMASILTKPVTPSNFFNAVVDAFGYGDISTAGKGKDKKIDLSGLEALQGIKILLVEDNLMNQQVALELLELVKMEVTIASDGVEALQILGKKDFALILMDIQMPRMDGISATKRIRELGGKFTHLPIIAMTANAMMGDRQKSLDAGMDDHISKPVDPKQLYASLLRWIKGEIAYENKIPDISLPGEALEIKDKLPGFEVLAALKQMGGNLSLYESLLKDFDRNYTGAADRIRKYIQNEETTRALRVAHTAKGLAATIGAFELSRTFRQVEQALKDNSGMLNHLLSDLEQRLNAILGDISSALPFRGGQPEKQDGAPQKMDLPQLTGRLEKLRELVQANDMASEDVFNAFKHALSTIYPREAKLVADALSSLKFKHALDILNKLLKTAEDKSNKE